MVKQYKINNQITAPRIRLLGEDNKQIGIVERNEALDYAAGQGADLVLIAESAVPPVAKIVDYKKFLYQEAKKATESKKSQKSVGLKELIIGGPFTGPGDVEVRTKRARGFLAEGHAVRLIVKFRGRQMAHPEFGYKILAQMKTDLAPDGAVEREPKFMGRLLAMTIRSIKSDHAKTKDS